MNYRLIKQRLSNDFWRNNALFFFGSLGVGALNYLYYPLMGHLMSPREFGEVQALFAILLDILVLFSALSMTVVNVTVNVTNKEVRGTILKIEQLFVSLSYVLFAGWVALIPLLSGFLKLSSGLPLAILYAVIFTSLLISLRQAFVQGMQDFVGVTINSLLVAIGKLILSALFVIAGTGVTGAIVGLAIGQLLGVAYISYRSRRHAMQFQTPWPRFVKGFKELAHLRFILPTLIVSLAVTALYSFDTIAAKHFLGAEEAGLYAGAATIGRIIFFVTAPIATVMFSSLKLDQSYAHNWNILKRSAMLTLAIGGSTCLMFVLFPSLIVQLLLGTRYIGSAIFLPSIAFVLLLASFVNLVLYYDLALRKVRAVWISAGGLAWVVCAIAIRHATPSQIIQDIFSGALVIIIAYLIEYSIDGIRRRKTR